MTIFVNILEVFNSLTNSGFIDTFEVAEEFVILCCADFGIDFTNFILDRVRFYNQFEGYCFWTLEQDDGGPFVFLYTSIEETILHIHSIWTRQATLSTRPLASPTVPWQFMTLNFVKNCIDYSI